jgi:syntaxin-binding protein 1
MGNICKGALSANSSGKYQLAVAQLEREFPWARKRWLLAQVKEADGDLELARMTIQQTFSSYGGERSPKLKYEKQGTTSAARREARPADLMTTTTTRPDTEQKENFGQVSATDALSQSPLLSTVENGWDSSSITPRSAERVVTTIFRWNAESAPFSATESGSLRGRARARLLESIQKAHLALFSTSVWSDDPIYSAKHDSSGSTLAFATNETRTRPNARATGALTSQRRRRSTSVRRRGYAERDRQESSRGVVSSPPASGRTPHQVFLILDRTTLPIATSVCRLHQLQQCGITAVEVLNARMQTDSHRFGAPTAAINPGDSSGDRPSSDAAEIYFLAASSMSLEALASLFAPLDQPLTQLSPANPSCAVLVSGHLTDEDLERFRRRMERSALLHHLGCFMEVHLDYVAMESGLFHCNHPNALLELFPASRSKNDRLRREACLAMEAQQLASVCETISGVANGHAWAGSIYFVRGAGTEEPSHRSPGENFAGGGSTAEQLAQLLAHELRRRKAEGLSPRAGEATEPAVSASSPVHTLHSRLSELSAGCRSRPAPVDVLVLDRTVDLATLFIHDFHYGAMAMDLCDASLCACTRFRVPLAEIDLDWEPNERIAHLEVDLDEDMDTIWRELRHRHIADAVDALSATFDAFLEAQPEAAAALRQRTRLAVHTGSGQRPEWYDIPRVRASCPTLKDELDTFLAHFVLIEVLLTRFSEWALERVAAMEQDLACCRTSRGRRFRHALARVLAIVENPTARAADKLRIALLYLVTQDIGTDELERLLASLRQVTVPRMFGMERSGTAEMDDGATARGVRADLALQTAWNYLNIALGTEMRKSRAERRERRERSRSRSRSRTRRDSWSNVSAYNAGDDTGVEEASDDFELCRYNNRLAVILRQYAENIFQPECAYPLAADFSSEPNLKQISPVTPRSAARAAFVSSPSASVGDIRSPGQTEDASATTAPNRTLVVYIAGGIMPSEARDVYRFAQRTGCSAIAGGSCILTPSQVLALFCQQGMAT